MVSRQRISKKDLPQSQRMARYNELKLKQLLSQCRFNYPATVFDRGNEEEEERRGNKQGGERTGGKQGLCARALI